MTKYFRHFWWAWPFLALKIFIFYWQTDRLDMMNVYEVPVLTVLFLFGLFALFWHSLTCFNPIFMG